MSTIASFMVGIIASGVSYAYVSRELVISRNDLIAKHLNAKAHCYYPAHKVTLPVDIPEARAVPGPFGRPQRECRKGSDSYSRDGGQLPALPSLPTPAGEHPVITDARNKWNAAVLRCSDTIVSALYGSGAVKDKAPEGGSKPRDS